MKSRIRVTEKLSDGVERVTTYKPEEYWASENSGTILNVFWTILGLYILWWPIKLLAKAVWWIVKWFGIGIWWVIKLPFKLVTRKNA